MPKERITQARFLQKSANESRTRHSIRMDAGRRNTNPARKSEARSACVNFFQMKGFIQKCFSR